MHAMGLPQGVESRLAAHRRDLLLLVISDDGIFIAARKSWTSGLIYDSVNKRPEKGDFFIIHFTWPMLMLRFLRFALQRAPQQEERRAQAAGGRAAGDHDRWLGDD